MLIAFARATTLFWLFPQKMACCCGLTLCFLCRCRHFHDDPLVRISRQESFLTILSALWWGEVLKSANLGTKVAERRMKGRDLFIITGVTTGASDLDMACAKVSAGRSVMLPETRPLMAEKSNLQANRASNATKQVLHLMLASRMNNGKVKIKSQKPWHWGRKIYGYSGRNLRSYVRIR